MGGGRASRPALLPWPARARGLPTKDALQAALALPAIVWLRHDFTQSAAHSTQNRLENRPGHGFTERTIYQEVAIERRDLLTEEDARARNASRAFRKRDTCGAWSATREDGDHHHIIAVPVANVL